MRLRHITAMLAFSVLALVGEPAESASLRLTVEGEVVASGSRAPLDGARVSLYRADTRELLADRIVAGPDGRFSVSFSAQTGPERGRPSPGRFWMGEISPNPVGAGDSREASVPYFTLSGRAAEPEFELYDPRGRRIPSGETLASGVYFYRLRFGGGVSEARKLVVLAPTRITPGLRRVNAPDVQPLLSRDGAAATTSVDVLVVISREGYADTRLLARLDAHLQNRIDAVLAHAPAPTVSTVEASLPALVAGEIEPSTRHAITVQIEEGEWWSLDCILVDPRTDDRTATLSVETPSGISLALRDFGGRSVTSGPLRAIETGIYHVYLQSQDIESAYELHVRRIPAITPGRIASGTLEVSGTRYFRFEGLAGQVVRSALDRTEGFSGRIAIVNSRNEEIPGAWTYSAPDGTAPTPVPGTGPCFVRLAADAGRAGQGFDYRVSLNLVEPPTPLAFDGSGHAWIENAQLSQFGDIRLYTMPAEAGDGLLVQVGAGRRNTLGAEAEVEILAVGTGSWSNPATRVPAELTASHAGSDEAGVLEISGSVLPQNDTYVLAVRAPAPAEGEYTLSVDLLSPTARISVDDDLRQVPDARTRSVRLAALVAPPGATIEVAAGDYTSLLPVTISSPEVALIGAHQGSVGIGLDGPGNVIQALDSPRRIAHLAVSSSAGARSTGLYVAKGSGAILENLAFPARNGDAGLGTGVRLAAGVEAAVLRRLSFDQCAIAVSGQVDGSRIESCTFRGGGQTVLLRGNGNVVRGNSWTVTRGATALDVRGTATQVLDNDVSVAPEDRAGPLFGFALRVEDLGDATQTTLIRGNEISSSGSGIEAIASGGGGTLVIEGNGLDIQVGPGQAALRILPDAVRAPQVKVRDNRHPGAIAGEEGSSEAGPATATSGSSERDRTGG